MTDKVKNYKAGSRVVGFRSGAQVVNLSKMFSERGVVLPHGENEI